MMRRITKLSGLVALLLSMNGCIPSGGRCFPYMREAGYFCYKEHNFGQHRSATFKQGVRDGCSTAEGRFRRDYSISSTSGEYREGWDLGRAYCKFIVPEEAKPGMRTQYQQDIDQKKNN